MAVVKGLVVCILVVLSVCHGKPVNTSRTLSPETANEPIKKKKQVLEDHIKGLKLERDGHVNKDYHHEVFLGKLVEDGTLLFDNMDGYRRLIDLFHQVDKDGDHFVSRSEMTVWIHEKIKEHIKKARDNNQQMFKEVDRDGDGFVTWEELRQKIKEDNESKKLELDKEFGRLLSMAHIFFTARIL